MSICFVCICYGIVVLVQNTHADRESCRILVEAMCGNLSKCMSLRACSVCFCAALFRSILGVSSSVSIYALCRYMEYGQKIKSLRVERAILTFISFCLTYPAGQTATMLCLSSHIVVFRDFAFVAATSDLSLQCCMLRLRLRLLASCQRLFGCHKTLLCYS